MSKSRRTWLIQDFFSVPKDPSVIIFLDRDDTLIKDFGTKTHRKLPKLNLYFLAQLSILTKKFNRRVILVIVTNQSKISQGETSLIALRLFHLLLVIKCRIYGIRIQRIITCPHATNANCECRKPKPTTILDTIDNFNCKSTPRFMLGNSISDIYAGLNAGCFTIGISERVFGDGEMIRNRLFLGHFTLESSFVQDIIDQCTA